MELDEKQLHRLEDGREYRSMVMTVRAAEDDSMIVEGYATTFNQPYTAGSNTGSSAPMSRT